MGRLVVADPKFRPKYHAATTHVELAIALISDLDNVRVGLWANAQLSTADGEQTAPSGRRPNREVGQGDGPAVDVHLAKARKCGAAEVGVAVCDNQLAGCDRNCASRIKPIAC